MQMVDDDCPAGKRLKIEPQAHPPAQHGYNNQSALPPGANSENTNQTEMKNAYEALGLPYTPTQSVNIQPLPSPQIQYGSSWRDQVNSKRTREQLVQKIAEAKGGGQEKLASRKDIMNDPHMNNLIDYAKKVEQDMFAGAESYEQYYQLLTEKIDKMQETMERERRLLFQKEQQQNRLSREQHQQNERQRQQNELKSSLHPVIELLWKMDEAIPFRQPVDPISLSIPDYLDIIKKPIDLSTIKKKLNSGDYQTPWDFINDMDLMFDNAKLYNEKTSRVHKWCLKLQEVFEDRINSVMTSLGHLCGQKFVFSATPLFCDGKSACTIAPELPYWSHSDRYVYCEKCCEKSIEICVEVGGDSSADPPADSEQEKIFVKRSEFKLLRNNIYDDRLPIERVVAYLVHACSCRDAHCSLSICEKIKKVVAHTKRCKRKQNSDCTICEQFLSTVMRHAEECKETMCPVPFCSGARNKRINTRIDTCRRLQRRLADLKRQEMHQYQQQMQIRCQVSEIPGQQTQQGAEGMSEEIINQFKQTAQAPQTPQ